MDLSKDNAAVCHPSLARPMADNIGLSGVAHAHVMLDLIFARSWKFFAAQSTMS
jgi:hypothetical protein